MKYYSAVRKDEILPLATTWTDPESIMLNAVRSDRKGQEPYDFIHMWEIKQRNKQTIKLIDRQQYGYYHRIREVGRF